MICPSHGPVLTETIADRIAQYEAWSTPAEKEGKKAVVLYASAYGYTARLAAAAYRALSSQAEYSVTLADLVKTPADEVAALIASADLLLVGSCTINRDAPGVIWNTLSHIDAVNTKGKAAGVFGSYGWSGEACEMIRTRLSQLKYTVLEDSFRVTFRPTDEDLRGMEEYALKAAALVK